MPDRCSDCAPEYRRVAATAAPAQASKRPSPRPAQRGRWLGPVLALFAAVGCSVELPPAPDVDLSRYSPAIRDQLQAAVDEFHQQPSNGAANGGVAMLLHTYDQFEAAQVYYRRAGLVDHDFRWPYLRALVLEESGDTEGALTSLQVALGIKPRYARARIKQAELLLALDRLEECDKVLTGLKADLPQRPEPLFLQGRLALRQAAPDAAIAAFTAVRELSGDFAALHHGLAHAYRLKGDAAAVKRHTGLAERSRDARANVADPVMAKVLALNISTTSLIERARSFAARGDATKALALLDQALAVDPESFPLHVTLAGLTATRGDYRRSQEHLDHAARLDPQSPKLFFSAGIVMTSQGRLVEAEEEFRRSLELDPSNADAWTQLGLVRQMRGQTKMGAEDYRKALEQDPWHRQAHWLLGRYLRQVGRPQEALRHLEPLESIKDPATGAILIDLGRAYLDLGEVPAAAATLRDAIAAAEHYGDNGTASVARSLLSSIGPATYAPE